MSRTATSTEQGTGSWRRLRAVFHQALSWTRIEREQRLVALCQDDTALLRDARALLADHDEASSFLEVPWIGSPSTDSGRLDKARGADLSSPGARMGPYALERCLGHGGMGSVYLASRADGVYDGHVAIKVLRRDLTSDELVARFAGERQILADLRHPHIAQLLDGGTTDDGRPYLVMEYVEGEPIDTFCKRRGLDTDARLRLFVDVCRTVHVAHQNLVVHRDLKPSNLLVAEDGSPTLLDFGVAKLLSPSSRHDAEDLTVDLAPLTLDYASPEQILGLPVTTACDVFGLGVVLFEPLTGRRPWRRSAASIRDLVAEVELGAAPKPSDAVDEHSLHIYAAGDHRRLTVAGLRRRLTGDLDRIVAKTLAADAGERYGSAEDLAREVERYLHGQPIEACANRFWYRSLKFVRRHRWAVRTAAVVVLALSGLFGVALDQQRSAAAQAARSDAVSSFLVAIFELTNPNIRYADRDLLAMIPESKRGLQVSARELLDMGVHWTRVQLADQPDVAADVSSTIGWAYFQLGLYGRARTQLENALDRVRESRGPQSNAFAAILIQLAEVTREQGDFERTERLLAEARAIVGDHHDAEAVGLDAEAHVGHSLLARRRGHLDDAETSLRRAIEIAQERYGDDHPRVAEKIASLGDLFRARGDDALTPYQQARDMYRRHYGAIHPRIAALHFDQGLVHRDLAEYVRAEASFREALAMQREINGDTHPVVAISLEALAETLHRLRRDDEAEPLAREALSIRQAVYDDRHPLLGRSFDQLGRIRGRLGDIESSERLIFRALTIWMIATEGADHPWVESAHRSLARIFREQGRDAEAIAHALRASRPRDVF